MLLVIIIGIIAMGISTYFALNKKSTFIIRIVALGALALMVIAIIICVSILISEQEAPVDWSTYEVGAPVEVKEEDSGVVGIVLMILFFLALFGVIVFLSLKEHKKHQPVKKPRIFEIDP